MLALQTRYFTAVKRLNATSWHQGGEQLNVWLV
jgi:hypothetical protein